MWIVIYYDADSSPLIHLRLLIFANLPYKYTEIHFYFFRSDQSCLLVFINDQILRSKIYTVQMTEIDKVVLYSYYHKHNMMEHKIFIQILCCTFYDKFSTIYC